MKVFSFNFKKEKLSQKKHYGVIAQEFQEIAPELVYNNGSNDHYLSDNYYELISHLIKKIYKQDK